MGPILIVCATALEARYISPNYAVLVCGIGKVDAAVSVTRYLAQHPMITDVYNIGSAGALRDERSGIHFPSTVLNHDLSVDILRQMGYPATGQLQIDGGDGSILATGDSFISDAAVRDQLAERADLVDMEGFAIAAACVAAGVRCRLIKHVSDSADAAAIDWPTLVDISARALADWLLSAHPDHQLG